MFKATARFLAAMLAIAAMPLAAHATDFPIGYISYDVTGTNLAEFDIGNLTGANSSSPGDSSAPVTTMVTLSDLSLTVFYAGGLSQVFGPSYFTANPDGSFNGAQLLTFDAPPTGLLGAYEAVLTGDFSTAILAINDGSTASVYTTFSTTLSDPGGLQDQDLAVINATATPEPATWMMVGSGLLLILLGRTRRFNLFARRSSVGVAAGLGCVVLLLPGAMHAQSVKLTAATTPSSGTAGNASVSITGSGFPSGTITPASVAVTLSASCGGTPVPATASAVTKVIGTTDKIAFGVPTLAAGTYYVAVSGTTSTSVAFSSSNCSTISVLPGASPVLTINTTNPVDWIINNGTMTIDYNSTSGAIWSITPIGTQDQLIDFYPGDATVNGTVYDPADGESPLGGTALPATFTGSSGVPGLPATYANKEPKGFYMDLSGFTTGTFVPGYTLTPDYLDFWVTLPASTTNTTEYEEHFIVTPNDPGIHVYFSLNHPATQPDGVTTNAAGTIGGQVQWIWRGNPYVFTNFYQKLADLSMVTGVKTPIPSTDDCFSADNGRNTEDATGRDTIALYPQIGVENSFSPPPDPASGIPVGFHRHYCVKYDYSSYEYIHDAHGLFGNKYGQWVVFTPGHDTFIDGPSKENLNLTGNILTIEANSNHYRTGGVGTTSIAAGVAASRIYGPYYVRINQIGMNTDSSIDGGVIQNSDDMFNDAVAAGSSFSKLYSNESTLVSKGYVPAVQRGSVAVQVAGVAGNPRTAWAVLSQPGVNHENSTMSYQYTMDISANGTGTFPNVVPGTYRLSVFNFGNWGEYRNDSIVVAAGNVTTVPAFSFQAENFGTVVGTIGTPDRSSHEFLHGAYTQNYADGPLGYDDRETYSQWNYWADWANSPVPGAPVYNLTDGPGYTATNNPLLWNYAHWGGFDPGIYAGACPGGTDATTGYTIVGCTSLGDTIGIPAYVNTLAGHSGTNGVTTPTPAWQIHFTSPSNPSSGYVVLSHALASSQAGQTVVLNSQTALTYSGGSSHYSDAVERSGLSGYTEWVTYQWPVSALNAAGTDNVITIKITGTNSNNSDDAFRLEYSTAGASPAVTGWHDYSFITKVGSASSTTTAVDTVPNP